jgi:hypothetical protein
LAAIAASISRLVIFMPGWNVASFIGSPSPNTMIGLEMWMARNIRNENATASLHFTVNILLV